MTAEHAAGPAPSDAARRSRRLLQVLDQESEVLGAPLADIDSMLDERQLVAVHWLTRFCYRGGRIAEIGSYTGGTTVAYGRALRKLGAPPASLEVYDLFEHSDTSRQRLAGVDGSNDTEFFDVWQRNTADYADLVDLRRGDFRILAGERTGPLEQIYVDVVKHESLINPLVQQVFPRLQVGGYLLHQDYFHWQSPWVVYSTELLLPYFEIVASCSNHLLILQQTTRAPMELLQRDLLALDRGEIVALMRSARDRWQGVRRGLIHVSLLNLAATWSEIDFDVEVAEVRRIYATQDRIQRYLDGVLKARELSVRPLW